MENELNIEDELDVFFSPEESIDSDKLWAYYIGKTMLNFGDIESVANQCLEFIPSEKVFDQFKNMTLGKKLNLIIAFVEARSPGAIPEDLALRFTTVIKKIIKASENRNLIAHNPIELEIEYDKENNITNYREVIVHLNNEERKLSLTELKEFSSTARILYEKFHTLYAEVNHAIFAYLPDGTK